MTLWPEERDGTRVRRAEDVVLGAEPGALPWSPEPLELTEETTAEGTVVTLRSRVPQGAVGLFSDQPGRWERNGNWVWPDRVETVRFFPENPDFQGKTGSFAFTLNALHHGQHAGVRAQTGPGTRVPAHQMVD